jgi:excisionase family DNA binding protein
MIGSARFEITYDAQADVLGIWFPGSERGARTREVAPGIHVDVTADGRVTAVEILDASTRYPMTSLRALESPADWLTLSEAAAEAGLKADTLRRQVANGRLGAHKRGRDWLVSRAALWTYLDGRAPAGRRPASRHGRKLRRRAGAPA